MAASDATSLLRVLGAREAPRTGQVVEGRVHSVSSSGMYFTVPGWDDGSHRFGPAPWPVSETAPVTGTRCLVIFAGAGIESPWVVATWPV